MEVITFLPPSSFAVQAEELFEFVEEIGFWTEVGEILALRE
jgi:hypothetical protein